MIAYRQLMVDDRNKVQTGLNEGLSPHGFHLAGIGLIDAGVALATRSPGRVVALSHRFDCHLNVEAGSA